MVVRFEVDACIPAPPASDPDDLVAAMAKASLSPTSPNKVRTIEDVYGLRIRQAGSYIPQSQIVEITTVSTWRQAKFDWSEAYPQLFLSQTPHHFLAVHFNGQFNKVEKRKLGSSDLQDVENRAQMSLRKLRQALGTINDIVVEHGKSGRLSLVCQGGEMKVYERRNQVSCLPEAILKGFEARIPSVWYLFRLLPFIPNSHPSLVFFLYYLILWNIVHSLRIKEIRDSLWDGYHFPHSEMH